MKRSQDRIGKFVAVKVAAENLDHDDMLVYFLDQTHTFNTTLNTCETEKSLLNTVASFLSDFGFNATFLFKTNKEQADDFILSQRYENQKIEISNKEFLAIHAQIKEKNSVRFISLNEENQSSFLYSYKFDIETDKEFILYTMGSDQVLTNKNYAKLFELVGSLVRNQLARIEEQREVKKIKESLEQLVEKKSSDLDRVVETLSQQYSELKYQHDKRVELIKEIHHRVNNNLQVISSLLSLYISTSDKKERKSLEDVRDRVQVMALIHLNVYKSVEMNLIDFKSYLRDLFSYLRSVNNKVKLFSNIETVVNTIKLDTLVPLGLLITEVVDFWIKSAHDQKFDKLELEVNIKKDLKTNVQSLILKDKHHKNILGQLDNLDHQEQISTILLSALTEQLEGKYEVNFNDTNEFKFSFID